MKKIKNINLNPVTNSLAQEYVFVDNELQESLKKVNLWKHFTRYGFSKKRTGYPLKEVFFSLLVWALLGKNSIRSFMGNMISNFVKGGKDVLYDFLKREDINWRGLGISISKEVYNYCDLKHEKETAFIVDDTIKKRSGKKVEGVSTHFDHTEGRCVSGQQVLQLGVAWPGGYIPIDNQIFIGNSNVHPLNSDFKNGKSSVAKDYNVAMNKTKHEQLEDMVKRALREGMNPKYILGDSWFGCRKNVKMALDQGLIGIFRMKRSKLKYRLNVEEYTLVQLYYLIKRRLEKT